MSQRNPSSKRLYNRSIYLMTSSALNQFNLSILNLTCNKKKLLKMTTTKYLSFFSIARQTFLSVILQLVKQQTCSITIKCRTRPPNKNRYQLNSISSKIPNRSSGHNPISLPLSSKAQPSKTPTLEVKSRAQTLVRAHKKTFSRKCNQIYSKTRLLPKRLLRSMQKITSL